MKKLFLAALIMGGFAVSASAQNNPTASTSNNNHTEQKEKAGKGKACCAPGEKAGAKACCAKGEKAACSDMKEEKKQAPKSKR